MTTQIPAHRLEKKIDEINNMTIEQLEHAHEVFSCSAGQSPFKLTMMKAYETAAKGLGHELLTVYNKVTPSHKRGRKGY